MCMYVSSISQREGYMWTAHTKSWGSKKVRGKSDRVEWEGNRAGELSHDF